MKRLVNFCGSSRGDTIIEVLIVLAILGLAFGISYSTANRGLVQARTAQEHSEALTYADQQIELLRLAVSRSESPITDYSKPFCMDTATQKVVTDMSKCTMPGSFYKAKITSGNDGNFTVSINWDGFGSIGPQQERLNYKIHPLTQSDSASDRSGNANVPDAVPLVRITSANHSPCSPGPSTCAMHITWQIYTDPSSPITSVTCSYDGGPANPCPNADKGNFNTTYPATGGENESHTFAVRAANKNGVSDPAYYTWQWVTSNKYVPGTSYQVYVVDVSGHYSCWYYPCYNSDGSINWGTWGWVPETGHYETRTTPGHYEDTSQWEYPAL